MRKKEYDVLCLGLATMDILAKPVDRELFQRDTTFLSGIDVMPGGDAMNQANVLGTLGYRVGLAARVGEDDFGKLLVEHAAERGVDTVALKVVPDVVTGISIVLIRKNGQRHFVCCNGNNESFCLEDVREEILEQAKVVSIGSLLALPLFDGAGATKVFQLAKKAGAVTVADTTSDVAGLGVNGIKDVLPYTDYFIPSRQEVKYLLGEEDAEKGARKFLEMGAKNVIVKMGEQGCLAINDQECHYLKTHKVTAVDTTGCGDNFVAGVIAGILQGKNLIDSCRIGNAMGALNATHSGAAVHTISLDDIFTFMKTVPLHD